MRPGWLRICLSGCVVALLLAACGPSATFRRAEEAERAGDWPTAVEYYRRALQQDPEDEDAAAGLRRSQDGLVDSTVMAVNAELSRGDFEAALQAAAPAARLLPDDPDVRRALDSIRVAGVTHWTTQVESGDPRTVYEGISLLHASYPNYPDVQQLDVRARERYGAELSERARAAGAEDLPALALALWRVNQRIRPTAEGEQRYGSLWDEVRQDTAFRYDVQLEGRLRGWATPSLPGVLAVHTPALVATDVRLVGLLGPTSYQESYVSSLASDDYLSGYRQVPNAAYEACQRDISRQEDEILRADREVLRAEELAHDALVARDDHDGEPDYDDYYDRWDDAQREVLDRREALQREREELQELRRRLLRTPPTVEEEVWSTYDYEVRDYHLTAQAELSVATYVAAELQREQLERVIATTSDATHEAHPTIGLTADPLIYPADEADLRRSQEEQALARLTQHLQDHFQAHRQAMINQGVGLRQSDPDAAADLLVRALLLAPSSPGADVVAWLNDYVGPLDPNTFGP